MAKPGRPTTPIFLAPDERKTLESWARRHSSSQILAMRCRIVLGCADPNLSRAEIAAQVGCNPATVTKWRARFAKDCLDGSMDAPRPGAQRSIGDDVIEAVLIDTLETTPAADTHWSTRGLAAKHGISHSTVAESTYLTPPSAFVTHYPNSPSPEAGKRVTEVPIGDSTNVA